MKTSSRVKKKSLVLVLGIQICGSQEEKVPERVDHLVVVVSEESAHVILCLASCSYVTRWHKRRNLLKRWGVVRKCINFTPSSFILHDMYEI